MSWRTIARKDLHQARRSTGIWLLAGLSVVVFVGYAVVHEYLGDPTFVGFVDGLAGVVGSTVPLLGLLLGYKSISHERASGSLFLTLSAPQSRRDLVAGTLAGRAAVLLVPTVVSLVFAGAVGAVRYGTEGLLGYPLFLFLSSLYGVAFVSLAVGLSMSTTADRRITLGALGGYVVFVPFWGSVHSFALLFLHRFDLSVLSDMPDWALLVRLLAPTEAFYRLLRAGFDIGRAARYADGPVYVDWWMGLVALLAWCVVPVALGYRRFRTADL
ncbi:ABC transporter permease subunit [Haloarcula salinisoli]|uniref:ABC transporter permease n=1 Tax=Haloarcula salinisoli TaxID=2487746 RepID=A0A8J7YMV4_9EURY|nr:ABC transporter permease subunit [Halomicroarcula salinisoli]MBX0305689.1 ABC transporter permease [Halomicroarcula salinisoli]